MTTENTAEPDFESAAEAAWGELEAGLAERLAGMGPDDLAIIESLEAVELHGATPYVQFCAWETERGLMLRAEAVSNHYLDATRRLSPSGERELEGLGFNRPTYGVGDEPDSGSANWYVDLLVEDVEVLACMTVRAFRRAYGITHPAFLTADGLLPDAPHEHAAAVATAAAHEPLVLAVVDSPDALREVTAPVLEELLGQAPHRDDDGDFLVPSDHGAFWVIPSSDAPALDLTATVSADVADRSLALLEVNRLNRRDPLVQHTLIDDTVLAHLRIDCAPFTPIHVRSQVAHFRTAVDEAIRTLTETLDAGSVAPARRRRRQAVSTLTELVRAEHSERWTDELDGELVAAICDRDTDLIVQVLRGTHAQLKRCRSAIAKAPHPDSSDMLKERLLRRQRQLLREALLTSVREPE